MKTSLKHLPENKRLELDIIRQSILDFCPGIEMIILFGSFARGDWVEEEYTEGHITYDYKSDFDLLLVFSTRKKANHLPSELRVNKDIRESGVHTRVSLILHSINFVNNKISCGNYFFTDIKSEGIVLYDSGNQKLARRKKLNPAERQKYAQADFDNWFESANMFYENFETNYTKGLSKKNYYKIAAFELHQATERYYHTILLVFTNYKPKTHDIEILGQMAKNQDIEFAKVFPRHSDEEKRLFELLKCAYVDARYKMEYTIRKKELEYLSDRVELLKAITDAKCKEKIKSFGM